jgi:hypothetical protein
LGIKATSTIGDLIHLAWHKSIAERDPDVACTVLSNMPKTEEKDVTASQQILDAAQNLIGNDVPRYANNEKIPEPLVEDQLDRYAGVTASKNDCKRMLAVDEWCRRLALS